MNTQIFNFIHKPLTLACMITLPAVTQAASVSEAEVEQLRAEVKALKSMMQQYVQQQNSLSTNLAEVKAKSETVAAQASTTAIQAEVLTL